MRLPRRFLALTADERRLLVRAALLVVVVRFGLGRIPFTALRRLVLGRQRRQRPSAGAGPIVTDLVVWAVDAVERRVPGRTTCLTRALTVQALLARRGYPSRLQVGVIRGAQEALDAHAWVECDGRIVVGGSAAAIARFTPLAAFDVGQPGPALTAPVLQALSGGR